MQESTIYTVTNLNKLFRWFHENSYELYDYSAWGRILIVYKKEEGFIIIISNDDNHFDIKVRLIPEEDLESLKKIEKELLH